MSKAVKWQIPFVSTIEKTKYRIDIYAEQDGTWSGVTQLLGGPQPFVTEENKSDDFFTPVRSQTGNIQVCTAIPAGGTLSLDDILPANNIDHPVRLVSISGNTETIEWQGFLSCEAYSQSYTSIPQILTLPVISVLEAMKSVELTYRNIASIGGFTIGGFIASILTQVENGMSTQVTAQYSSCSSDILTKYIFESQFYSYKKNNANGQINYVQESTSLYDILTEICKFMGWVLREQGSVFYFMRNWGDELGMMSINISNLEWRGADHKRSMVQGAKAVSVVADLASFDTSFEMPICPSVGLNTKNYYPLSTMPMWYYDKCTQANVGVFTSHNITNCFLSRFYGVYQDSTYPWDTLCADIGFGNSIYLAGQKFEDTSYSKLCTIKSVLQFNVVCGISGTLQDVGYLKLRIKEETSSKLHISNGYIRCGMKFLGKYYSGVIGTMWNTNSANTFKIDLENGIGEMRIEIPRLQSVYTFAHSQIELYIYNDFDINNRTSALISEVTISYEPPFNKDANDEKSNKYEQKISNYNESKDIQLKLASSFGNTNALSHIYGIKTYTFGQETNDYIEPITSLSYALDGGTTEDRRPEVDLLNRLAAYYGEARQTLELKVKHPTAVALPLLKLNGISPDTKKYLPLAESRDWIADVATLTCFETPE